MVRPQIVVIRRLTRFADERWRSPQFRNTFYFVGNYLLPPAVGLVFLKLVTARYPTEAVGIASSLLAASGFVAILSRLGFEIAVMQLGRRTPDQSALMIDSYLSLSALAGVVASVSFLVLSPAIAPQLNVVRSDVAFSVLFVLGCVAYAWTAIIDGALASQRRADLAFWKNAVAHIPRLPLVVILASYLTVVGIFGAYAVAFILSVTIAFAFALPRAFPRYRFRPRFARIALGNLAGSAASNYVVAIVAALQTMVVNLIVLRYYGAANAAFFYVSSTVMGLLLLVPSAVGGPMLAETALRARSVKSAWRSGATMALGIVIPAVALLVAASGFVLRLLGPDFYAHARPLFIFLAVAGIPGAFVILYQFALRAADRHKELIALGIVSSIVVIGGCLIASNTNGNLTTIGVVVLAGNALVALFCIVRLAGFGPSPFGQNPHRLSLSDELPETTQ